MAKATAATPGYKPTVADKRYAQALAALSSISDEAAQLCSELDEAVKKRLSRQWIRGWEEGFSYGRDTETGFINQRYRDRFSELEALLRRLEEEVQEVQEIYGPPPPSPPHLTLV